MESHEHPEAQSDTAGASTFGKYAFQFHWALCEIIEKHSNKQEYSLLVEYHEDVVIGSSSDLANSRLGFYQVKNIGKPYTVGAITSRKPKEDGGLKNSILGKLFKSSDKPQFKGKVQDIGLVCSSGFSFETKGKMKLDLIKCGDLEEDCLSELTTKIQEELGIKLDSSNLQFIVPTIQLQTQEDFVLAQFAKLVDQIFGGAQCSPSNIYRAIVDDMYRKGRIQFDYSDWNRLANKKSINSNDVNHVLSLHSTHPLTSQIESTFDSVANEMAIRPLQATGLKSSLKRLYLKRKGFSTSLDLDITQKFKSSMEKIKYDAFPNDAEYVTAVMNQSKSDGLEKLVSDKKTFDVEVFYAILVNQL